MLITLDPTANIRVGHTEIMADDMIQEWVADKGHKIFLTLTKNKPKFNKASRLITSW